MGNTCISQGSRRHASLVSTQIYAYVDTEMKKLAIEKSSQAMEENIGSKPAWQTDEEMIRKLFIFRFSYHYIMTHPFKNST